MAKTRKRHLNFDSLHAKYGGHHQKSGKWTHEEEMHADKLIHGFQTGTLNDCTEGATLRSYLARKLNCAPMRISKKFAGQCIGKHTYVTNTSNNPDQTMWSSPKSAAKPKSPRLARPARCRQSPRSHTSSTSYHYYDSDETETSEEDDTDTRSAHSTPPVSPSRNTRRVTLGSGTSSAFVPISLHHPASPPAPPVLTPPPPAPPVTPVRSTLKMDEVDLDEVYHSSYSSTPSCCAGGTSCTAHHEEQQWREVLTTLFGETDSSSPVRNIFHQESYSTAAAASHTQGVNVSAFPPSMMCFSTPPSSPRGVTSAPHSALTLYRDREVMFSPAAGSSSSSTAQAEFMRPEYARFNPFYQLFK